MRDQPNEHDSLMSIWKMIDNHNNIVFALLTSVRNLLVESCFILHNVTTKIFSFSIDFPMSQGLFFVVAFKCLLRFFCLWTTAQGT